MPRTLAPTDARSRRPPSRLPRPIAVAALLVAGCGSTTPTPAASDRPAATGQRRDGRAAPDPGATPAESPPTVGPSGPARPPAPAWAPPATAGPRRRPRRRRALVGGLDRPAVVDDAGDGSGRLFVAEQGGRIRIIENGGRRRAPFLDITRPGHFGRRARPPRPRVPARLRCPRGTLVFVHYTDNDGDTNVSRVRRLAADDPRLDPASASGVILSPSPSPTPTTTAAGPASTPTGCCSSRSATAAAAATREKRASTSGRCSARSSGSTSSAPPPDPPYGIPADNPYAAPAAGGRRSGSGASATRCGQHRPGHRAISGSATSGQNAWEEVDVQRGRRAGGTTSAGTGWRAATATSPRPAATRRPDAARHATTATELGCSVIGGVVYRGAAVPALARRYLFSRLLQRPALGDRLGPRRLPAPSIAETGASISAFGRTRQARSTRPTSRAARSCGWSPAQPRLTPARHRSTVGRHSAVTLTITSIVAGEHRPRGADVRGLAPSSAASAAAAGRRRSALGDRDQRARAGPRRRRPWSQPGPGHPRRRRRRASSASRRLVGEQERRGRRCSSHPPRGPRRSPGRRIEIADRGLDPVRDGEAVANQPRSAVVLPVGVTSDDAAVRRSASLDTGRSHGIDDRGGGRRRRRPASAAVWRTASGERRPGRGPRRRHGRAAARDGDGRPALRGAHAADRSSRGSARRGRLGRQRSTGRRNRIEDHDDVRRHATNVITSGWRRVAEDRAEELATEHDPVGGTAIAASAAPPRRRTGPTCRP